MRREEKIVFEVFDQEENIPGKLKDLFKEALKAAETAYAPYSQFKVGCSVLLESGEIILGNNQENGAYPSGLCAERVALFSALSTHPGKKIAGVAIACLPAEGIEADPSPCGSCRQIMIEAEQRNGSPVPLVFGGKKGPFFHFSSISALLPLPFRLKA